jgi:hypothetical protein
MASKGFKVTSVDWARVPADKAFDAVIPVPLETIFTGLAPLVPAVTGVQDQSGDWDVAGQTRRINLADGSHTAEVINVCERPERFEYTVGPFSGPVGIIVDRAEGSFLFEELGGGTLINWSYTWMPKPGMTPFVWVLSKIWRVYAKRVVHTLAKFVEQKS